MQPEDLEMAGKLGLSALPGGLVGFEREMHRQSAGLRLAVGSGFRPAAVMTTLIPVAPYVFQKLEVRLTKGRYLRKFVDQARESPALVAALEGILQKSESSVREIDIQRNIVDKRMTMSITASCPENHDVDKLSRAFSELADVVQVEID